MKLRKIRQRDEALLPELYLPGMKASQGANQRPQSKSCPLPIMASEWRWCGYDAAS